MKNRVSARRGCGRISTAISVAAIMLFGIFKFSHDRNSPHSISPMDSTHPGLENVHIPRAQGGSGSRNHPATHPLESKGGNVCIGENLYTTIDDRIVGYSLTDPAHPTFYAYEQMEESGSLFCNDDTAFVVSTSESAEGQLASTAGRSRIVVYRDDGSRISEIGESDIGHLIVDAAVGSDGMVYLAYGFDPSIVAASPEEQVAGIMIGEFDQDGEFVQVGNIDIRIPSNIIIEGTSLYVATIGARDDEGNASGLGMKVTAFNVANSAAPVLEWEYDALNGVRALEVVDDVLVVVSEDILVLSRGTNPASRLIATVDIGQQAGAVAAFDTGFLVVSESSSSDYQLTRVTRSGSSFSVGDDVAISGRVRNIGASESYAYVGSAQGLQVAAINQGELVVTSTVNDTRNWITTVVMDDRYVYAIDYFGDFIIVNRANGELEYRGGVASSDDGIPEALTLLGDFAVIAVDDDIVVLDTAAKSSPVETSRLSDVTDLVGSVTQIVSMDGDDGVVAISAYDAVLFVIIDTSGEISFKSRIPTPGLSGCQSVLVDGQWAIVGDTDGSVVLYNVTDPEFPNLIDEIEFQRGAWDFVENGHGTVYVAGTFGGITDATYGSTGISAGVGIEPPEPEDVVAIARASRRLFLGIRDGGVREYDASGSGINDGDLLPGVIGVEDLSSYDNDIVISTGIEMLTFHIDADSGMSKLIGRVMFSG